MDTPLSYQALGRGNWRVIGGLFILGIAFKGPLALLAFMTSGNVAEDFYDDLAKNLLSGHGYVITPGETPNLWRAPLYPLFLTGIYGAAGLRDTAPIVAQILLEGLTGVVLFFIGLHIFERRAAILGALLWALYPISAYYASRLLSESLFTFLLAVALLLLLRAQRTGRPRDLLTSGAMLGLATLTRPSLQLFPLAISLSFLRLPRPQLLLAVGCLVAGMGAIVTPWTVRNYLVTERFVPVTTGGGYNLWLGNHLPTNGRDTDELPAHQAAHLQAAIARISNDSGSRFSPESDGRFYREAMKEIAARPLPTAWLMVRKVWRFWFSVFQPRHRWVEPGLFLVQFTILSLATFGLVRAVRAGRRYHIVLITIVYFVAIHALTVATFRYSVPLIPHLFLLGAYGILDLRPCSPASTTG